MKVTATNKEKYFWNMMGSLANALASLVLSIVVNRVIGSEVAGVFAFAYANAQLMLTVGAFEVRPFQSTDIVEKYNFSTYFIQRLLTCAVMLVATIVYVFLGGFDIEKSLAVILFSLFKMVEAFTDVYAGRFQQKDRIDIAGKLFFIRSFASTVAFVVVIVLTNNLVIGALSMFAVSFALFFVYDIRFIYKEDRKIERVSIKNILLLSKDVLPLFIGTFVLMFLSNQPKYAINYICGDEVQNIYNILFMPAFVINLFSLFAFRPILVSMSSSWLKGNLKRLFKDVFKIYAFIIAFTVIAIIAAWLIGIPVLSAMYGIDLSDFRIQLVYVMIAGGISALVTFSYYVIVVMRKQTFLLIGYGIGFVYALIFASIFVSRSGITGAIFTYLLGTVILLVAFVVIIIVSTINKVKQANNLCV